MPRPTDPGLCLLAPLLLMSFFAPVPVARPIPVYLGTDINFAGNELRIATVYMSTPAYEAGLSASDRISAIDDREVKTRADLIAILRKKKPGDFVDVVVHRGNHYQKVTVKLAAHRRYPYLGTTQSENKIDEIVEGSPAKEAGLKVNDTFLAVDAVRVRSVEEFMAILVTKKAGDVVTLTVLRGGLEMKLSVKLGQRPGY